MLLNNSISSKISILLFLTVLVSCGGGGGSTPASPGEDTISPEVIETSPFSGETGIKVNVFINVTFNEPIQNVNIDQVSILPVDMSGKTGARLKLDLASFTYNNKRTVLTIQPPNDWSSSTRYQVVLESIKDSNGNALASVCKWEFGTTDLAKFSLVNTALCKIGAPITPETQPGTETPMDPGTQPGTETPVDPGTQPGTGTPIDPVTLNNPTNVIAVAGDNSVIIKWEAPISGSEVTYYKLEKSIDNGKTFSFVNDNISSTDLFYTDPSAQNGKIHIYRVFSGNNAGLSRPGTDSNSVTPKPVLVTAAPEIPTNVEAIVNDGSGTVTISWTKPNGGGAVTFYKVERNVANQGYKVVKDLIPATVFSYIDTPTQNGISHVYRVSARNAVNSSLAVRTKSVTPTASAPTQAQFDLISQSPGTRYDFGNEMVFTPDGNTIIIGEPGTKILNTTFAGSVQVFTKLNGFWEPTPIQTLTTQTLTADSSFGLTLAISKDGSTLAIGGNTNSVDIYTIVGNKWQYLQTILPMGTTSVGFGSDSIEFSPNSTLLAIGDRNASPGAINSAGVVQLFSKSADNSWNFLDELTADLPIPDNFFGAEVTFSPNGSILAISESNGDKAIVSDSGSVHLFSHDGTNWLVKQTLVSDAPVLSGVFGGDGLSNSVSFTPDGNTLIIAEIRSNKAHIFRLSGVTWNPGEVLKVASAVNVFEFGFGVSTSADGKTIAIGGYRGTSNGVIQAGNVYLFNQTNSKWILSRTLSAQVPTLQNAFGIVILFSPVRTSNELAVFELRGDLSSVPDSGVVSIIDISQLP